MNKVRQLAIGRSPCHRCVGTSRESEDTHGKRQKVCGARRVDRGIRIRRRRRRRDHLAGVAPVSRRQGRRARRHGADGRARGEGCECRSRHPGLSGRLAVQAERPVERHGQRPARHHPLPARLRQRQGARVQRHADAGPGAQSGARPAAQRFAIHEGHPGQDRGGRRDGAVRRVVRRRHGIEARLHQGPRGREGPQIPRRRSDLRIDVAIGRCLHRLGAVERHLQRLPDRRRRGHGHQPRQLRLIPPLRADEMPDRAGRKCPVVHVRADADVEEDLRQARQEAAGRRRAGRLAAMARPTPLQRQALGSWTPS